jgi:phosphatidylglycerol:prolipoprotein diacylglycerol transferase
MHPILFSIGDFFVGTYGVMIVIGVVAALLLGVHRAKQRGVPADFCYDLAFVCLLSGFIGARVLFIIVEFEDFLKNPMAMLLSRTGFVFMGGLITAMVAAILFIRWKKQPMWEVGDIAAPSLALAHGFGRIGCFFAGCCYGGVCPEGFPLGMHFPHLTDAKGETIFSFAYWDHVRTGIIPEGAAASAAVYPSQLFEAGANFLIAGALVYLWRKRAFPGQIFLSYLMLYGAARFGLEFLRGDSARGVWDILGQNLSTSQILSIIAIIGAVIAWTQLRGRPLLPVPTTPSPTNAPGARARHGK